MSEIERGPIKIIVADVEYAAFDEDHTWGDFARWVVAHGNSDAEEAHRIIGQMLPGERDAA